MASYIWGIKQINDRYWFQITSTSAHWAYGVKIALKEPKNLLSMEVKAYESSSQEIHM